MSEEKNLGDKLDETKKNIKETAEKAKESVKETAEKAKAEAKEFSEDVKKTAEKAKAEAKEFGEEVKETAKEFNEDVNEVLSDGKNVAIIAHLTIIGWIVALVMNGGDKKTEFASFYIRQMLGIIILGFVLGIIPVINLIGWILPVTMWIVSIIGVLGGKKKPVFLLGNQFQEWFKSL